MPTGSGDLKEINAALLAALKETITPLILLGDYIGNEWEGKIGIPAFDRCAIIGRVRVAIATGERA
jgi:hypothetical protein